MNIFRILAQGDGSINEPNVSAFLGYLLDPNEDHGLGSIFLERFLQLHYNYFEKFCFEDKDNEGVKIELEINNKPYLTWLVDKEEDGAVIDLSKNGDYEVKVFFEQAFSGVNGKQIVDIMLIVHEMPKGEKKEQYFKNYVKNDKKLKHVFLIEVKISDSAAHPTDIKKNKEGQLIEQAINSRKVLKELLSENKEFDIYKDISIIFVAPDILDKSKSESKKDTNVKTAFEELLKLNKSKESERDFTNNPKSLIFWNSIKDSDGKILNEDNIEKTIDNILYATHEEKAEPIPQYTLDTLKSFSNFIYSDFSYKYKRLPTFEKDDIDNLDKFKNKYFGTGLLNDASWKRIEGCVAPMKALSDDVKLKFSKTHPISVYYNDKKIFSLTRAASNLNFHFVTRNFGLGFDQSDIEVLIKFGCKYWETFLNKAGRPIYEFSNTNEVPLDVVLKILTNIIKKIK